MIRSLLIRALIVGIAVLLAPGVVGTARADQKDPKLPALFDKLKSAPDGATAAGIERQIWAIWVEANDAEIDKLMEIGQAAMAAREYGPALGAFDRIIEKRPDFAEGWNRRATLFYLMGEYSKSLEDIDHTLKLEPRHFGALSGLGLVNLALEHNEAAAKAYQRVLDFDPQNEEAQQSVDAINTLLKRKSI